MRNTALTQRLPAAKLLQATVFLACLTGAACTRNAPAAPEKEDPPVMEEQLVTEAATAAPTHTWSVIFDGGTGGYHSYRIPSIVRTNNGVLIAFAEGRMSSNKDHGNINLVYKRSTNNGSSWSALGEVVGVGPGTWGNPTAVVDRNTNRVWLFMNWNSGNHNISGTDGYEKIDEWGERRVYLSYSDNEGITWSTPQDMTNTLLPPNYTWDAIGPGVGYQTGSGMLVIPAQHRNIYSTDHGTTWHYQLIPGGTSEGTIVELNDGRLMRNDRPTTTQWEISKRRRISRGAIAGSFSSFTSDDELLDPACQGSILRYTGSPDRIMFLNSASTLQPGGRCKMRIRISYDGGITWPISRRIHDYLTVDEACNQGKGGYSSMVKTADYTVGMLIEINENVAASSSSHRSIEFHKVNLPWILNGSTEPL